MRDILNLVAAPHGSPLPPPRLLVVFAHPDDEVIALGARMERCIHSRFLTLTDGAPKDGADALHHGFVDLDGYRVARRRELMKALAHAGLPEAVAPPFAGSVPDQTAAFHLVSLAQALASEILAFAPKAILTHPYEGGHPDHDACAFAVRAAMQIVQQNAFLCPPLLIEAPFYFAGDGGAMQTGRFSVEGEHNQPIECELSPAEQANKRARLACFASQQETLSQFGTERECFRIAPDYNFTHRPQPGRLFYEYFPWGMTADRFCALASEAQNTLFRDGLPAVGLPPDLVGCR